MLKSLLVLGVTALSGCAALGGVSGVVVAIASGTFTHDPALGLSLAIATKAAVDDLNNRLARNTQHAEQEAIAQAASGLQPGEEATWAMHHRFPPRDVGGEVLVTRLIDTPLTHCRELLFSVTGQPSWFVTTACRSGDHWQWATAEPAVERWGSLQ
jgi:hypothetical protein